MKTRNGFVSNSSSSSFIVSLKDLTDKDKRKILGYKDYALGSSYWDERSMDYWQMRERDGVLEGWTSMDNKDLSVYLGEKLVKKLKFSESEGWSA
jgi:hypothetical protein